MSTDTPTPQERERALVAKAFAVADASPIDTFAVQRCLYATASALTRTLDCEAGLRAQLLAEEHAHADEIARLTREADEAEARATAAEAALDDVARPMKPRKP